MHACLYTAGICRTQQRLPVVALHGYHSEVPEDDAQLAQIAQREAAHAPDSSDLQGRPLDLLTGIAALHVRALPSLRMFVGDSFWAVRWASNCLRMAYCGRMS